MTIVDVARHLGLSKTTVSDALQGKGRISKATHARVTAAASSLGYVHNRAARQLRNRTVGAFGLYIPPVVRNFSFYMEFAFGAADAAAAADADLTLFARDPERSATRPFQVDGAIAVDPLPGDPIVSRLFAAHIPVVTVGRHHGSANTARAVLEAPHRRLVHDMLDHLASTGHRHPALLSSDNQFFSSWAADVLQGYRSWCATHGLEPHVREVSVLTDARELAEAVTDLASRSGIDALVCGPQGFAARAQPILEALGLPAGRGFGLGSLVGEPVTEIGNPLIASVDLKPWEFGAEAARLLTEVIATDPSSQLLREHQAVLRL